MKTFRDKTFTHLYDDESTLVLEESVFEGCTFKNCGLALSNNPHRRSRVSRVALEKCYVENCSVGPALIEDSVIDTLSTNDLLLLWGTLFSHVTVRGEIGKLKLNRSPRPATRDEGAKREFERQRTAFYSRGEWALDLSEGSFLECEISGIPAGLIRRNPDTQVVVTREKALCLGWRKRVATWNTFWPEVIDMFLSDGEADTVLVAPTRGKKKEGLRRLLDGLMDLREAGVAEED